jgi:hypothetical protein
MLFFYFKIEGDHEIECRQHLKKKRKRKKKEQLTKKYWEYSWNLIGIFCRIIRVVVMKKIYYRRDRDRNKHGCHQACSRGINLCVTYS